jgi:hypothetical protein
MSYVLDLVVHEADVLEDVRNLGPELFLEFKLDGLSQLCVIPPRTPAPHIKWDFPVRLILHVNDFSRSFMYAAMVAADAGGGRVNFGRAKFPLKSLPIANPKRFKFPLMSSQNNAICVAHVHLTASLSTLVPYQSNPTRGPSYTDHTGAHGRYWSSPT